MQRVLLSAVVLLSSAMLLHCPKDKPFCLQSPVFLFICATGTGSGPLPPYDPGASARGGCVPGCTRGYCGIAGSSIYSEQAPTCIRLARPFCEVCGVRPSNLIGADAFLLDQVPPGVATVTPLSTSELGLAAPVVVRFTETLSAASLQISGSLLGGGYTTSLSESSRYNDTLTLLPTSQWLSGPRSVTITADDLAGNSTVVALSFYVRNRNEEATAAANAIQAKATAEGVTLLGTLQRIGDTTAFFQAGEYYLPFQPALPTIIYNHPQGTFRVYGSIYHAYVGMGMHDSWLGPPVSDEYDCGILVRCSNFQNGYIRADLLGASVLPY